MFGFMLKSNNVNKKQEKGKDIAYSFSLDDLGRNMNFLLLVFLALFLIKVKILTNS